MQNRRLMTSFLMLFLIASAIISILSNTAVAITEIEVDPPQVGEYLLIKIYPDQQTIQSGQTANFTIIVANIDPEVNLTEVTVLDLLASDCSRRIGNLPANSNFPAYSCSLDNIQEPLVNWATVKGTNPVDGTVDQARDSAAVNIIDISVALEADPPTVTTPGGDIDFSVNINNTGSVTVTLRSLISPQFGDLTDPTNGLITGSTCIPNPDLPLLPPNSGNVVCSFTAEVLGEPATYPVQVTASAIDIEQNSVARSSITTIDITAPISYASYFPLAINTLNEPNDSCTAAFPILTNKAYHFFPDDKDDWYYFDLNQTGNVLVELSNFVPRLGQIIIYKGEKCSSLQILKNNGNDKETKPVLLGIQPPDRYFILVINDGEPNDQDPYKLQVYVQ